MSKETQDVVRPDGIGVTITDAGTVLLKFDHDRVPAIQLSASNAKRVGGTVSKAGDTAGDGRREFND